MTTCVAIAKLGLVDMTLINIWITMCQMKPIPIFVWSFLCKVHVITAKSLSISLLFLLYLLLYSSVHLLLHVKIELSKCLPARGNAFPLSVDTSWRSPSFESSAGIIQHYSILLLIVQNLNHFSKHL